MLVDVTGNALQANTRAGCRPACKAMAVRLAGQRHWFTRSLSDLSDRREPGGKTRPDLPVFEAHSGAMQRKSGQKVGRVLPLAQQISLKSDRLLVLLCQASCIPADKDAIHVGRRM
jgi:hypothetical protein